MPISQFARLSLITSGEHLRLAREALNIRQVYPSAHFTVLRGALVGASQGVWILAPDERAERQERALTVLEEMYTQMVKHYNALDGLSQGDLEVLENQQEWLRTRVAGVTAKRAGKAKLNVTEVIASAAKIVFPGVDHQEGVRRLWRQMSADAHALGWSVFQRSTLPMGPSDRRAGLSEGTAPGSLTDIAAPFLASYRILKVGWSLFDRRCEQPRTTST